MQKIQTTNARWKQQYDLLFRNTPRHQRRTKYQIKMLRGKAKLQARIEEEHLYQ